MARIGVEIMEMVFYYCLLQYKNWVVPKVLKNIQFSS